MGDAARQADLRRYAYLYAGHASRPFRSGIGQQNKLTHMMPDTDGEVGATTRVPQIPLDVPVGAAETHNNAMGTQTDDVRIDYLRGINRRFEEEEARAERAEHRPPPSPGSESDHGFLPAGHNDHEAGGSGSGAGGEEHVVHMGDNYYAPVNVHVQIQEAQAENAQNYLAAAMGYMSALERAADVPLPDDDPIEAVPQYPRVFAAAGPAGPRRQQVTRETRGRESGLPRSHAMRLRNHNVHRHATRQRLLEAARTVQSGVAFAPRRRPNGVPGTHRIGHAAAAA